MPDEQIQKFGVNLSKMDEYHIHYPDVAPVKSKRNRKSRDIRKKREKLLKLDPFCKYCRKALDLENSTLDHVIPLAKGGSNKMDNLAVACNECNFNKGNKLHYKP